MSTAPRDQNALASDHLRRDTVPQPKPRRALWTLYHGAQRLDASIINECEAQFFVDGTLFKSRRCASVELAEHYAGLVKGDYKATGWIE